MLIMVIVIFMRIKYMNGVSLVTISSNNIDDFKCLFIYIAYINDLRNTAYWIVRNKTLNETTKGNLKNTLIL